MGWAPAGQASSPAIPQAGGSPGVQQGWAPAGQQSSPGYPQPGGYPAGQPSAPGYPQQGGYPGPQGYPQQGGQVGYPAPQALPPQPDPPGLTVDASYSPFAFLLAITKPKIQVNGHQVPVTRWGPNHIPVGPGQHHVRVSTPWLFDMGPATASVPVQPGQGTRVYYKAPVVILLNGAIGPVPQKAPGLVFLYITWGFVALIFLLNLIVLVGVASA
ncbi:hypothetical protein [Nocardia asteroides]|uniref:hypothetical protein n=1 Tax=Nocardia asteroides TaxID=1824 RepID=UPI001E5E4FED|nr:hypothetical protein [Nocardia asteroides]UGT59429.1 hypothetical protein LTT61_19405 [Nocardia asteroides]